MALPMSWAGKQHPLEVTVEWLAPIPLALAAGWAVSHFGINLVEAIALGVALLIAGLAVMKRIGGERPATLQGFEPAQFESVELDELLLEEKDAVLELNDRLDEVASDSRVVRLFERDDPTPGELVDRIVDFLADGRRAAPLDQPTGEASRIPDASAALHDALANIRASLR
jgi:hypothetical protein